MESGTLIAHNAPFDMRVLAHCLHAYHISWRPLTYYACTCAMGRACYPHLENHKLNTLCEHLGLGLAHHHAGSDSLACAERLLDYIGHGIKVDRFLRQYDLAERRTQRCFPKARPREAGSRR
jgi:DNA polymerase III epsilon subunit-like protein